MTFVFPAWLLSFDFKFYGYNLEKTPLWELSLTSNRRYSYTGDKQYPAFFHGKTKVPSQKQM